MRKIIYLCFLLIASSCYKPNDIDEDKKLYYPYLPDQPFTVIANIIPTDSVKVDLENMLLEVNADYYNRYGIAVKFNLLDRISLPDKVVKDGKAYTPGNEYDNLSIYITPQKYMINTGTYGYYYTTAKGGVIVLGDQVQLSQVLAHEIGHYLGLKHTKVDNNTMNVSKVAWQYDRPTDFNQDQIDIILEHF